MAIAQVCCEMKLEKIKLGDALVGGNRCAAVESRQRLNQPLDLQPVVNGLQFRDQSLGP
jgi:hypothetical protein